MNKYSFTSAEAPQMPALGKGLESIKDIVSQTSKDMQESIVPLVLPALGAYVSNTTFKYPDGTCKELCGMMAHLVGVSGIGKGQLTSLVNAIMHRFSEHDEESKRKLAEWQKTRQSKGSNKDKPVRPNAALWFPPADVTTPGFLLNAMDCEAEGNRTQYYNMPEVEMVNQLCGGHGRVSTMLRNIYDKQKAGALRATSDGVTGTPVLRANLTFSSTPTSAQKFYKTDMTNGTPGRIVFSYKARKERSGIIPVQGGFSEEFYSKLDKYLDILEECQGNYIITPLNKLAKRLAKDMADYADLADDDTIWDLSKRSIVNAWKAGCICYLLNEQTWTPAMGQLVEWLVYHDLWSKVQVFGNMLKIDDKSASENSKSGPKNMLDDLPDTFSQAQLEILRASLDKSKDATKQLRVWTSRKYIEYSAQTGMYTKTESYLNRKK